MAEVSKRKARLFSRAKNRAKQYIEAKSRARELLKKDDNSVEIVFLRFIKNGAKRAKSDPSFSYTAFVNDYQNLAVKMAVKLAMYRAGILNSQRISRVQELAVLQSERVRQVRRFIPDEKIKSMSLEDIDSRLLQDDAYVSITNSLSKALGKLNIFSFNRAFVDIMPLITDKAKEILDREGKGLS